MKIKILLLLSMLVSASLARAKDDIVAQAKARIVQLEQENWEVRKALWKIDVKILWLNIQIHPGFYAKRTAGVVTGLIAVWLLYRKYYRAQKADEENDNASQESGQSDPNADQTAEKAVEILK